MIENLKKSPLFAGMTIEEIEEFIVKTRAKITEYRKDEFIFLQGDVPKSMYLLVEGVVAVCNDTGSGKRSILALFDKPGEIFGEIFLFLNRKTYDHYTQVLCDSKVLEIEKPNLFQSDGIPEIIHQKIVLNMLYIFASKTYYLNRRLSILSCSGLRQKIAKLFLKNKREDNTVEVNMNREELADFLNVTRPSLSRELMKMQEDGLIVIDKKAIRIFDLKKMKDICDI
ncbi:Crp/Fnr family transcriptional regulator [Treponema parvum]|uniref:Crp/Fnr family transcriptional regulator n=1 Tax=Treponema parvum TaxID=138851 RepID=A0A975EZI8_9SPIR|nr:Crp/Fnr family transcriptional regulator [Treponema parvum]QTQ11825.1 Crp/Fnr family transcriptional regulator [Treponema parvum]